MATESDEQPARRRSSRASIVPPPRSAPKNPVVPNKKNKVTTASDSDLSEQESESEDEQQQTGRKRKARSSTTGARGKKHGSINHNNKKVVVAAGAEGKPKAVTKKATREIKPKPRRAPITGLNPLPTLFSLFPAHALFTLLPSSSDAEPEPLPTPTEAPRTIFVFGTGDMGQNGLGVDDPKALDEIKRPRKHIGFAEKVTRRELGWEGGVADLVCGGMHTLAIDGQGKVWSWGYVVSSRAIFGLPSAAELTRRRILRAPTRAQNQR